MAGDWIKMRHNLEADPDVLRIAEIVGVDRFSVVGRLHTIWTWADQHSVDGCAVRATTSFLDEMVCCANFSDALRAVGWLAGRDWDLQFPNFDRHNGESAKKRAQAQRSMQKRRAGSATNVAQNAQPEKRREEKSNKPPLSPTGESPEKVWMEFPTKGGAWELKDGFLQKLRATYPRVNLGQECKKAAMWLEANPERLKTAKGMPQFLNNWLSKAFKDLPPEEPKPQRMLTIKEQGDIRRARQAAERSKQGGANAS